MGRAGSGSHSSGGGSFGGGHHSGGSSSGGHRVGSNSHRAGGSSFGSSRPGGGSGFGRPTGGRPSMGGGLFGGPPRRPPMGGPAVPPPPPRPVPPPPHYWYRPKRNRHESPLYIEALVIILAVLLFCRVFQGIYGYVGGGGIPASTIVRTKLTDSHAYRTGNVTDDLGWLDSKTNTEKSLKTFYKETGVQPYIYFKAYDSSLTTDSEKETWAKNYFDNTVNDSDGFLFVYFAEKDSDNDVGYMAYVTGSRAQSVFDSEALEIFWGYIDKYWSTDLSTDDVIVKSFTSTATAIMHVSTTKNDIIKYVIIAVIVVGGGVIVFKIVKEKNRRDHEKAEEAEKILNTPLEKTVEVNDSTDGLIDKYTE